MPNRKAPRTKKILSKSSLPVHPDAIEAKRDQQSAEIERICSRAAANLRGCSKNAYPTLARGWGRASGHVRARFLAAALLGWLLHVERLR